MANDEQWSLIETLDLLNDQLLSFGDGQLCKDDLLNIQNLYERFIINEQLGITTDNYTKLVDRFLKDRNKFINRWGIDIPDTLPFERPAYLINSVHKILNTKLNKAQQEHFFNEFPSVSFTRIRTPNKHKLKPLDMSLLKERPNIKLSEENQDTLEDTSSETDINKTQLVKKLFTLRK
jgi:hypothetical protein